MERLRSIVFTVFVELLDETGSDWYVLDLGLFAVFAVELGCLPIGSDLVISRFAKVGVTCMTLELGESSPNE